MSPKATVADAGPMAGRGKLNPVAAAAEAREI